VNLSLTVSGHKFWACDKSASADRCLLLCQNETVYLFRKIDGQFRIDSFECGTENGQVDLPVKAALMQFHEKVCIVSRLYC
jgi:hypothetical protein